MWHRYCIYGHMGDIHRFLTDTPLTKLLEHTRHVSRRKRSRAGLFCLEFDKLECGENHWQFLSSTNSAFYGWFERIGFVPKEAAVAGSLASELFAQFLCRFTRVVCVVWQCFWSAPCGSETVSCVISAFMNLMWCHIGISMPHKDLGCKTWYLLKKMDS